MKDNLLPSTYTDLKKLKMKNSLPTTNIDLKELEEYKNNQVSNNSPQNLKPNTSLKRKGGGNSKLDKPADTNNQVSKFNLSEKIIGEDIDTDIEPVINKEDVKEFIRLLKEETNDEDWFPKKDIACFHRIIDKLAGSALI